jgi:cytoskeleton protein RodZ
METNFPAGIAMMSNDKNKTAETPLKHSWGARFKQAREAMNLTEKDAAGRLHLKTHIITSIEAENFADAPPPLFMRGYIRSYARLLNLSDNELAQALTQMNLAPPAPTPVANHARRMPNQNNNPMMGWSTTFVVIVLVGLVGMWWWSTHGRNVSTGDIASNHNDVSQQQPATPDTNPQQATQEASAAPVDSLDLKGYVPPNAINAGVINAPAQPQQAPALQAQGQAIAPLASSAPTTIQPNINEVTPIPGAVKPAAPAITGQQDAQTQQTAPETTTAATPPVNNSVPVNAPANDTDIDIKPPVTSQSARNNNTPESTVDTDNEDEVKTPAHKPQQTARNNVPDFADSEMSVPEQGLENEPSDNNN